MDKWIVLLSYYTINIHYSIHCQLIKTNNIKRKNKKEKKERRVKRKINRWYAVAQEGKTIGFC